MQQDAYLAFQVFSPDNLVKPLAVKAHAEMVERARQEAVEAAIESVGAELQADADRKARADGQ